MHEKSEKLLTYCKGDVSFHFDVSIQGRKKSIELSVTTKHNTYHAKAGSEDFYASVDMVIGKVMRQVKKHRQKMKSHRNYTWEQDVEAA